MATQYFGTDGIRARFGEGPLTPAFIARLGAALGQYLTQRFPNENPVITIGRDTRSSGEILERALCSGLAAYKPLVYRLGVVPTPAIAFNLKGLKAHLGIAITASHNPAHDNGIKLFNQQGFKLTCEDEAQIEALLETTPSVSLTSEVLGESFDGLTPYADLFKSWLPKNAFQGFKIVVDTANGATLYSTPNVLNYCGAELIQIGNTIQADSINDRCGSEHPTTLSQKVKEHGATLGLAHDGDGDRIVLCDEQGNVVPGDCLLGILAVHALQDNTLAQNTLVATIQSNARLDFTLKQYGIKTVRTEVGDRNVLYTMQKLGATLGGESSGHIIFGDLASTGDGLLAALKICQAMLATDKPLSALAAAFPLFPQVTVALVVPEKPPLETLPTLSDTIQQLESSLAGRGRILVRYSGTEPKIRLLAEAPSQEQASAALEQLKLAVIADLL